MARTGCMGLDFNMAHKVGNKKTQRRIAEAVRPKTPSNPPQITHKCKVIMRNLP